MSLPRAEKKHIVAPIKNFCCQEQYGAVLYGTIWRYSWRRVTCNPKAKSQSRNLLFHKCCRVGEWWAGACMQMQCMTFLARKISKCDSGHSLRKRQLDQIRRKEEKVLHTISHCSLFTLGEGRYIYSYHISKEKWRIRQVSRQLCPQNWHVAFFSPYCRLVGMNYYKSVSTVQQSLDKESRERIN